MLLNLKRYFQFGPIFKKLNTQYKLANKMILFIFKKMELYWKCVCTFWDLNTCNRYCKTFCKYWPWPRSILHISVWNNATFKDCYNFRMFIFYWKCAENNNFDMCIQPILTRYTLLFYQIEPLKNGPSPVLSSSLFRDS